ALVDGCIRRDNHPFRILSTLQFTESTCCRLQIMEWHGVYIRHRIWRWKGAHKWHDIWLISRDVAFQIITQVFIAGINKRALYASQHHGSIDIEYVLLQFLRVFYRLLAHSIMIVVIVNDDSIIDLVVEDFIAEYHTRIIQIISLCGVNAPDLILRTLC